MRKFLLFRVTTALLLFGAAGPLRATAQAPLYLANDQTTVRGIDFSFANTQTFEESTLQAQMATSTPGSRIRPSK